MRGRRLLWLVGFLLIAFLLTLGVSKTIAWQKKCDLKEIEIAYECPDCGKIYDEAGTCRKCSTEDEEVALERIEVCVKTGYVCEDCGTESLKPGKCESCGKELTAKTVKSKIIYRCPKCRWRYDAPGNCEDCTTDEGEPVELERICKDSGTFPHVSE